MIPFLFITAQENGGEQAGGSNWTFLIYIALFVAIFYFLLIRPGQKQKKEHQRLVDAVKKGDEVMTAGGMYGTVIKVGDDHVMLEVAKKTVVKLSRGSISKIVSAEEVEEEAEEELTEEPADEPAGELAEEPAGETVAEEGEGQEGEPGRKEPV